MIRNSTSRLLHPPRGAKEQKRKPLKSLEKRFRRTQWWPEELLGTTMLRKAQHSLLVQGYKLHLCWHSTHISTSKRLHFSFWKEIPGTGSPHSWKQLNNGTTRDPVSRCLCAGIKFFYHLLHLLYLCWSAPALVKAEENQNHQQKRPQGWTKPNRCQCAPPACWLQLLQPPEQDLKAWGSQPPNSCSSSQWPLSLWVALRT